MVEVWPCGVLLVEGVYLLRTYLRPYWDFAMYVDTPREVRLARANARGENDADWIARWAAADFGGNGTRSRCVISLRRRSWRSF